MQTQLHVRFLSKGIQKIQVTSQLGIDEGDELLVKYGGSYFGIDRDCCECPHKEFHGGEFQLVKAWTSSGRSARVETIDTQTSSMAAAVDVEVSLNQGSLISSDSNIDTTSAAKEKSTMPSVELLKREQISKKNATATEMLSWVQ